MKSSLRNQVLFASLAALVIVGTGCERRGRAPMKSSISTNTDKSHSKAPGVSTTVEPSTTAPVAKKTTVAPSTSKDVVTGKMEDCVFAIDTNELPTAASFQSDIAKLQAYRVCQRDLGVFTKPEIQSSTARYKTDELMSTPPIDGSDTMRKMFDAISLNSNDDVAHDVLKARVTLMKSAADQMIAKYADFEEANTPTASLPAGNIAELNRISESAGPALENLEKMKSVSNGIEHAK